jgi:hypothetical protein
MGRTPLHVAVSCGCLETCALVVRTCKDNLNSVDIFGQTALDNAIMVGEKAIAALLESNGGLRGDHAQLAPLHQLTLERVQREEQQHRQQRRMDIQQSLPERQVVEATSQQCSRVVCSGATPCCASCNMSWPTVAKILLKI